MLSVVCIYVSYVGMDRVMARFKYFNIGFQERIAIARATHEMGRAYPYTGTGLGTFEFVFPRYQDSQVETLFDYAHNDWVQLFAETGWVGFLIISGGFIWFMGFSLARWRKRRDPLAVGIGLGGMGALVSIAVHSLSEFNLHLPANALLLALILPLIYLALHSEAHGGQERFSYRKWLFKAPLWIGVPIVGIATLGAGAMARQVIQVWQADSLARTVWDSATPFVRPSDQDLKRAWTLAPGNATYWAWMARRLPEHPDDLPDIHGIAQNVRKDLDLYLLGEGIKRNPTAWAIWRDLGWAAFFKMGNDPNYLPLAQKAFDQVRNLRPYAPQVHLEFGIIGLAAYARKMKGNGENSWKEAFCKALSLDSSLLPRVLDQLIFYLGQEGANEVRGLLSEDARGYIQAAEYLLKQGFQETGLKILKEGEGRRDLDVKKIWAAYQQQGRGTMEERDKLLDRILTLDSQHPPSLLARGKVLEALKSQEQRGGSLRELGNLREVAWALQKVERQKKGSPVEIYYFLGRVAEEEGNFGEAKLHFQKSLNFNPQYFPAWVHLRDIMARKAWSVTDQVELENLERKINLFDMDRVVGDAWRWGWAYEGCTSWVAPFRIGQVRKRIEIHFSGDHQRAWKLLLDGRFVAAWAGSSWHEIKAFSLPTGEHVFRLVQYREPTLLDQRILPFNLEIRIKG
jgi:tetratricopeptide (TPR) repeat protein